MSLSLLVTSKDTRGLREFLSANHACLDSVKELVLMDASGLGQAYIGNQFSKRAFHDVIGLVHSDCVFKEGDLEALAQAARAGNVAGLVGARLLEPHEDWRVKFVWGKDILKETPVSTLDGCSVFFRKDIPITFDPTFEGFHLVVEDFCLQATLQGIPIVVPAVNALHLEQSTRNPEWQKEYARWRDKLMRKWSGARFETT